MGLLESSSPERDFPKVIDARSKSSLPEDAAAKRIELTAFLANHLQARRRLYNKLSRVEALLDAGAEITRASSVRASEGGDRSREQLSIQVSNLTSFYYHPPSLRLR
jgi:hypothetical protein